MERVKSFRITDELDKRLLEYVHKRKATGEKCRFSDILNDAIRLYLDTVTQIDNDTSNN